MKYFFWVSSKLAVFVVIIATVLSCYAKIQQQNKRENGEWHKTLWRS